MFAVSNSIRRLLEYTFLKGSILRCCGQHASTHQEATLYLSQERLIPSTDTFSIIAQLYPVAQEATCGT